MNAAKSMIPKEQGVTSASLRELRSTLPGSHFVRARSSRVEHDDIMRGGRTHCVSTRLHAIELAALQSDARAAHKRMGELLRDVYFSDASVHVPPINLLYWQRLGLHLEDLHRLAAQLNAGILTEDVRPMLARLLEDFHVLRAAIIGQPDEEGDDA